MAANVRLYDYILDAEVELGRIRRGISSGGFPPNTAPALRNIQAILDEAIKKIREDNLTGEHHGAA